MATSPVFRKPINSVAPYKNLMLISNIISIVGKDY